jgi:uncharacterized protein YacL
MLTTILGVLLGIAAVAVIVFITAWLMRRWFHLNFINRVPFMGPRMENLSNMQPAILVDTSVIIDGRIADIAKAGFVPGGLLVPRFVLAELQNIADSSDAMRRSRGRRGLEMLHSIKSMTGIDMTVIDQDVENVKEVDHKLVALAKMLGASILTTDYNLNRVAQIEGVRVLNINELANAVRPVVLPGERMMVKVVQAGKEKGQGVGYLADGTMIVVDKGDKMIGQDVETEITRVFQTVAGKMLFAAPVGRPIAGNPETANRKPEAPAPRPHANGRKSPNGHNGPSGKPAPKPQAAKQNGRAENGNARPKRKNVTQRLEDSLVELTSGNQDS